MDNIILKQFKYNIDTYYDTFTEKLSAHIFYFEQSEVNSFLEVL